MWENTGKCPTYEEFVSGEFAAKIIQPHGELSTAMITTRMQTAPMYKVDVNKYYDHFYYQ